MNQIFNGVSFAGIIKPGYSYIVCENSDRGECPPPIEFLYFIKEDKDILRALDMEFSIVMADTYDLIEFLEIRKINKNCHEFKVLCNKKDSGEEVKQLLYLHRIQSFEECLRGIKKLFGVNDHN